jgi:Toprim domain
MKLPESMLETLAGTPGQAYVERRGISVEIADAAGVRYAADWDGRPAVIVELHDRHEAVTSVHGRYLQVVRGQDKMHTIGPGGGVINVLGGWRVDPFIIVEGLFDALSLAVCGFACVATIGRHVSWLPEAAAGRQVYVAFDNGRSGDESAELLLSELSDGHRVHPPGPSQDWNSALVKRGPTAVTRWLQEAIR